MNPCGCDFPKISLCRGTRFSTGIGVERTCIFGGTPHEDDRVVIIDSARPVVTAIINRCLEAIDHADGAVMPVSVALHAVKRADSLADKRVCVVGTSFIGLMVAQWSNIRGTESVTVCGRSDHKKALVENLGLLYDSAGEGSPFDVIFECAGYLEAIEKIIELSTPGSTIVLVGNPVDDVVIPKKVYWRILRSQLDVRGSWNSAYCPDGTSNWHDSIEALESHLINVESLISDVIQLSMLEGVLSELKAKDSRPTKISVQG